MSDLVDGSLLIEWILANMNHTRQVYKLVEFIHDQIRKRNDYIRHCETTIKLYKGSEEDEQSY